MHKRANEADAMLNVLRDTDAELAALGTQEPSNWGQMSYDQKVDYLDKMKSGLQTTETITNELQDANQQKSDTLQNLQNLVGPATTPQVSANRKAFNLRRFSQQMPTDVGAMPSTDGSASLTAPAPAGPMNAAGVRQMLDGLVEEAMSGGVDEAKAKSQAANRAYQEITSLLVNPNESTTDPLSKAQGSSDQTVRDAVNTYYSSSDEAEKDQAASLLARTVFPQDDGQADAGDGEVPAIKQEGVKVNVANLVKSTNDIIKRLAQKHAASKAFNLSKTAQHKTLDNVIMYDQNQVTRDQFTGQPISQWHLVERNKVFGLKLTDYWGADWEKVWRETVMDKYDPAYIERRFEVDRNIPPTNNYQLQPGEKRRITPPEYSHTEARLEAKRTEMNKERGYAPSEPGTPYNWKKANAVRVANMGAPAPLANVPSAGEAMGQQPMNSATNWQCVQCGNKAKNGGKPIKCEKCGREDSPNFGPSHAQVPAPTGPSQTKTKAPTGTKNVPIQGSADTTEVDKFASTHGGIFFDQDELKFVVFAGKKKKKFDTYYEAEEFKMLVQNPSAAPSAKPVDKQKARLTPQQADRKREINQHADMLGIDG